MIFIDDKYTRIYYQIIDNARNRNLSLYTEIHHVIPECLFKNRYRKGSPGFINGSANDAANLVKLTAREHFICHWLLTKMVMKDCVSKMHKALMMMRSESTNQQRYNTKITARIYARIKEENNHKGKNNPSFDTTLYNFYHSKSGAHEYLTQYDFYTKYSIPACNISLLVNGKQKSVKGWKITDSPPIIYNFYHSGTNTLEKLSAYDFYKKYGIARSDVWNLINRHSCKSIYGWSLI